MGAGHSSFFVVVLMKKLRLRGGQESPQGVTAGSDSRGSVRSCGPLLVRWRRAEKDRLAALEEFTGLEVAAELG